jgi:hypothetical protein
MLMKSLTLYCSLLLAALPAFAQTGGTYSFPTKTESLLRRIATVVTTSGQPVGTVQGTLRDVDTNIMTISVRTVSVTAAKTTEYAVTLQIRDANHWRSPSTYVDYDELDGLIAGINKTLALQPAVLVVRTKYETRGGLLVGTYCTEKSQILGWLELNPDQSNQIKMPLETLRDFRDLLVTAKKSLDALRSGGN